MSLEPGINAQELATTAQRILYCCFFLLGYASLLPWNSFISCQAFLRLKLCGTSREKDFESWVSVVYFSSQILSLGLNVGVCAGYQPVAKIVFPLVTMIAIFVTLAISSLHDQSGDLYFAQIISFVAISGICQVLVVGEAFAASSLTSQLNSQAISAGQALAGVCVSTLSCLISSYPVVTSSISTECASVPPTLRSRVFWFFLVTAIVLAIAVLATPYIIRCTTDNEYMQAQTGDITPITATPLGTNPFAFSPSSSSSLRSFSFSGDVACRVPRQPRHKPYRDLLPYAGLVCTTFTTTLAVFPSLVARIGSAQLFSSILFVLFNASDFIGRLLAGIPVVTSSSMQHLWVLCISRIVLLPLVSLCDISGTQLSVVFKFPLFHVLFVGALGVSNGLLVALAMMRWPLAIEDKSVFPTTGNTNYQGSKYNSITLHDSVPLTVQTYVPAVTPRRRKSLRLQSIEDVTDSEDISAVGATVMVFSVTLGLVLGSLASFPLVYTVTGNF